ncbi:PINc/VapC family ATPase, partial [Candidatus Woesearchaeota archaeon]|nr:PINc/VapC family ATPase [Candidatus Woesearchaeota archaeon]
ELEHQSNQNRAKGFLGLDEIETLKKRLQDNLVFMGLKPNVAEIKYASLGEIDSKIRQLAYDEGATLLTSDRVQYNVARAKGMRCLFVEQKPKKHKVKLEKFFDDETMSVHLKDNNPPYAKKGFPGQWAFVKLRDKLLTQSEIKEIYRDIIEATEQDNKGFIEIEREGSIIIQLNVFRIVITRPPFSETWEITAVRAVKKLDLKDYELTEKLYERISKQAEGILIAGAPGMGKSTFAAALIEDYAKQNKIIKTIEAPRDLILPDSITQYAISHGSPEEIHDVLLLSRPDYTLFDEMRNTIDFSLFADLRLAGIGLAGVIHGTTPVDAIQRFIGKLELGIIPQVIDTVIFIKHGRVHSVLSLKMEVKVPNGMTEADLARPIIVINNFETNKPMYELYTYGEQTVLVPVKEDNGESKGIKKLASDSIKRKMQHYSKDVEVEVISENKAIVRIPEDRIAGVIGKQGSNISKIEQELGIGIDVQELKIERKSEDKKGIKYTIQEDKNLIKFELNPKLKNKEFQLFIDGVFIMNAVSNKKAMIKFNKKNQIGEEIEQALNYNKNILLVKR